MASFERVLWRLLTGEAEKSPANLIGSTLLLYCAQTLVWHTPPYARVEEVTQAQLRLHLPVGVHSPSDRAEDQAKTCMLRCNSAGRSRLPGLLGFGDRGRSRMATVQTPAGRNTPRRGTKIGVGRLDEHRDWQLNCG